MTMLIADVVKQMQIGASAEEVFEYIKKNPLPGIDTVSIFLTNGVYDTAKYIEFLNNPENYKNYPFLRQVEQHVQKNAVPAQKLEVLLNFATTPSKSEIEYEYNLEKQKMMFEYVKVSGEKFPVDSSEITESMIKNYYNAHKDTFIEPEMADLYFLKFAKEVTAADEQFYYNEMMDLRKKIETSGESLSVSFSDEARIESDDPGSAENGGDLGWFGKGTMVAAFDSVAFTNKIGTISDPIKTQYGYHLILVEGKELKDGQEKVKARHILRKIIPTVESLDRLAEMADSVRTMVIDNGIKSAAELKGSFTFDSTGFFRNSDMIPKVGYVSGVGTFAFRRDDSEVSERLENDEAFYVFAVKNIHKKGLLPLENCKEKIVSTLRDSIQLEKARAYTESLKAKLAENGSPLSLKGSDSTLEAGVTDTISVNDYIPGIGFQTKVNAVASALPVGKVSSVFEFQNNYYIVKTIWKGSSPQIDWTSEEVKQIKENAVRMNQQGVYSDWSSELKRQAKIESNVDQFYLD
jgi:parvulin-like peptidyl-prolyl isomerase